MTTQTVTTPRAYVEKQNPIAYSFKQTLNNWKFWAPLAIIYTLVSMALGGASNFIAPVETHTTSTGVEIGTPTIENAPLLSIIFLISIIVSLVIGAILYRNALRQVDSDKTPPTSEAPSFSNWTKDIKWGNYILTSILTGIIMLVFIGVLAGIVAVSATTGVTALIAFAILLALLGTIFAVPFITFAPTAALDGFGPKQAIATSFTAVKTHYWKVIGNLILFYLIIFGAYVIAFTLSILFALIHPIAGLVITLIVSFAVSVVILPATFLLITKLYDEAAQRYTATPAPQEETTI